MYRSSAAGGQLGGRRSRKGPNSFFHLTANFLGPFLSLSSDLDNSLILLTNMSTKTTFRGALSRYAERSVTANSIYAARQDETRRRVLSAEEREIQRDIAC